MADYARVVPELPEIEHLRRMLEPRVIGARVTSVILRRRDVVRVLGSRRTLQRCSHQQLLDGTAIMGMERRGKFLALIGQNGRVLILHMGMSGSLIFSPPKAAAETDVHAHCVWRLTPGDSTPFSLIFRDPRRFGGLWPLANVHELQATAWARLGPDALDIDGHDLHERLRGSRQPIKSALLDQRRIAGIGNIYADEALFAAGIHPLRKAGSLACAERDALAEAIRSILLAAIASGGSTLRDYRDPTGQQGWFAFHHNVYGKAGQPCPRCNMALRAITVGQRTTVYCRRCQRRSPRTASHGR